VALKEQIHNLTLINGDCMDYMKSCKDNEFDLAIVDPPYGIDASKPSDKSKYAKQKNGSLIWIEDNNFKHKGWDDKPAGEDYFNELVRISKGQIIWGVNFYDYVFGVGRIIWDKLNDNTDQYDCEIAYCSLNDRTDIVRYMWAGFMQGAQVSKDAKIALLQQGNKSLNERKIHPTQKPVKLYEWLLTNYAEPNQKILDTHLGSGSSAIAAHYFGCEFTGIEIDEDYFNASIKRITEQTAQLDLLA